MTKITKEWVDIVTPKHGRTSCDEASPFINGSYRIEDVVFKGVVIERKVESYVRCLRCYLLDNLGSDTEHLDFKITPTIELELKQPDVEVTVKKPKGIKASRERKLRIAEI
jgi:hypothetical protein